MNKLNLNMTKKDCLCCNKIKNSKNNFKNLKKRTEREGEIQLNKNKKHIRKKLKMTYCIKSN